MLVVVSLINGVVLMMCAILYSVLLISVCFVPLKNKGKELSYKLKAKIS